MNQNDSKVRMYKSLTTNYAFEGAALLQHPEEYRAVFAFVIIKAFFYYFLIVYFAHHNARLSESEVAAC